MIEMRPTHIVPILAPRKLLATVDTARSVFPHSSHAAEAEWAGRRSV